MIYAPGILDHLKKFGADTLHAGTVAIAYATDNGFFQFVITVLAIAYAYYRVVKIRTEHANEKLKQELLKKELHGEDK